MKQLVSITATLLVGLAILGLLAHGRADPVVDLLATDGGREAVRCDVAGDSRASRVLEPGHGIAIETRVPRGAELRFALGTTDGSPAPEWRLSVESIADGRVVAEEHAIPEHAWKEHRIDLRRWGGQSVRLRVAAGPARALLSSHVCFAMPRFVTAPRGRGLVLVVLLDTLRADHASLYGYERPTTPALEALGRDGIVFDDFATDTSWTRASVTTLFTGQSALVHGVLNRDAHLGPSWPTLAERLRAAGAHTVALSTNPNVLPFWGLARGFDRFVDVGAAEWTANTDAARVLDVAREVTAGATDEWTFLYVHINDAHAPYDPPTADAAAVLGAYDPSLPGRTLAPTSTPAEVQGARDRYDGEIAHLDRELGRFFDDLERGGLYDAALIVVVGDHGEEFMDHGGIYHGHTLYREQLDTPLVVKLPGAIGAGRRRADAATMRDVAPTIEAILGLDGTGSGRALLNARADVPPGTSLPRFAVTDMDHATVYAVEDEASTYILQTRPETRPFFFDRGTDPRQRRDLAPDAPPAMARLAALLETRLLTRRAGWHVRTCGADTPTRIELTIESTAPIERIESVALESTDVYAADEPRKLRLQSDLAPQMRQEESFGRLVSRRAVDDDELVFQSAGTLTVAVSDPAVPVRIGAAAGSGEPRSPIDTAAAAAPATYAPPCDGHRTVYLWYAGVDTHPAIDRTLEERLRELGYLH